MIAVAGLAVTTAGAGLWLTHRSLQRERQLNALKSQFVSSVSHELRAPVASMRLMAEALQSGKVTEERDADEFRRVMAGEGARLPDSRALTTRREGSGVVQRRLCSVR